MPPPYQRHIFVCTNERPLGSSRPSCKRRGSEVVLAALKKAVATVGLAERVRVNSSGCLDACEKGISVVVYPDAVWYGAVQPVDVDALVGEHLVAGRPLARLQMKL